MSWVDGLRYAVVFLLSLAAGSAIFIFGSSYYSIFPTNRSWWFKIGLPVLFLILAAWLAGAGLAAEYWQTAYAYFVAAAASAASPLCGPWLARLFKAPANTLRGVALAKLSDSVVTVGVIFFLVFLIGIRPGAVFLQWGNLTVGLVVGLSAFAVFASLAYRQYATFGLGDGVLRSLLPWILVFVFSNAFMEELWMRGIFLGPLDALMGRWGALVATSLVFTAAHLGVTYMTGAEKLRFLFILLPLALAWGFLMQWTGSLLGSTLFHAGGDLLIINGFVGALYGKPAEQTAQPSPA